MVSVGNHQAAVKQLLKSGVLLDQQQKCVAAVTDFQAILLLT
jgi:hypothetical protein